MLMARGGEAVGVVSRDEIYDRLCLDPREIGRLTTHAEFDAIVEGLEFDSPDETATAYYAFEASRDYQTRLKVAKTVSALLIEGLVTIDSPELSRAERTSLPAVVGDYFSNDPERHAAAEAQLEKYLSTNVFEILDILGHVTLYESDYEDKGFSQDGYDLIDMFAHSVLHADHPVEILRRLLETLNECRAGDGFEAGMFERYYLVEMSEVSRPEDMPVEVADSLGYNTATWAAKIRLTAVDASGHRITESASVCGVDAEGVRRDGIGMQYIRRWLGLEPDSDIEAVIVPEDGLEGAFWVDKRLLNERIISLIKRFDSAFKGPVFFGVDGQTGNYDTVIEQSQEREAKIKSQMKARVAELAVALRGADCEEALLIMAHHAKDFATEVCVMDESYDPGHFGVVAAKYIEIARLETSLGDEDAARRAIELAKATAVVDMCGLRLDMNRVNEDGSPGSERREGADQISGIDSDSLKFKCPHGHDNERPGPGLYISNCRKCNVDVSCGMTGPNVLDTSMKEPSVLAKLWQEADAAAVARKHTARVAASADRLDRQTVAREAVEGVFGAMFAVSSK